MKILINFDEDEVNAIMFWFMTYEKKKKKISKIDASAVRKILFYSKIGKLDYTRYRKYGTWRDED